MILNLTNSPLIKYLDFNIFYNLNSIDYLKNIFDKLMISYKNPPTIGNLINESQKRKFIDIC